jgi:uncharacterized membrane protein YkoI
MCVVVVVPTIASGQEDRDSDVARDLYLRGEIRPLSDVLPIVRAHTAGDVISIRLGNDGGRWIYWFRVVAPNGHLVMVEADAATATIINAANQSP